MYISNQNPLAPDYDGPTWSDCETHFGKENLSSSSFVRQAIFDLENSPFYSRRAELILSLLRNHLLFTFPGDLK